MDPSVPKYYILMSKLTVRYCASHNYDNLAYLAGIPRPSPLGEDDKNPFGVGFW